MSRNILVVGQSHIAAIRSAAKTRREATPEAPRTRVIHTGEERYRPEMEGEGPDARFGPSLIETIRDQLDRHGPLFASVMGGNFHNTVALVQHERPFDFHLAEGSPLPLDPDAEPIPEALVRAALEQGLALDLLRLRRLAAFGPFIHIESPPPLRDGALIAAQAEAFFKSRGLEARGVAPAGLRWRIWRLNSRIVRQTVETLGCRYLPVPATLCDAEGFLLPHLAGDATHGNEEYGEALIRALEAMA
jgi:hypothetical protein